MELRHLRYFVAVAEEGHLGRAAARLHVSAPTLSQQIKAVEREIGAPLLVRHPRGVDLTPAGQVLLERARIVIRAAEDAVGETRRVAGVAEATLRLGMLNGLPEWLPVRLADLIATRAPGCRTVLVGGSTAQHLEALERGEVDLALLRCPVTLPSGTRLVEVATEELGVLMSGSHPLAAGDEVDAAALSGQELLWFARRLAPEFHDAVTATLRKLGGHVVLGEGTMSQAQSRLALPLRQDAVGLSSARAAAPPELVWRPLRDRPLSMTVGAAWRTGSRNPALRALLPALSGPAFTPEQRR